MANIVWHEKWDIELDLTRQDLGHESREGLWELLYSTDRMHADRGVPVSERGLRCGGVCRKAGVVAWMYLRERSGRREAVHERSEDEQRHQAHLSDEHKAYQERIVRTAESAGFRADSEVRTSVGPRSWIQTDTLVQGEGGLRIGWEVQLSSAGAEGPRSVKARAGKAAKYGITPAWHTHRGDYATRNDTHWTRSNRLPAHVIAKSGDLRVVSGFRLLDFWQCDDRALYRCPDTSNRCGKMHVTPKVRDLFFDDLVRHTAAGTIAPISFRVGLRTHRFWVWEADRDRLDDHNSSSPVLPDVDADDEPPRPDVPARRRGHPTPVPYPASRFRRFRSSRPRRQLSLRQSLCRQRRPALSFPSGRARTNGWRPPPRWDARSGNSAPATDAAGSSAVTATTHPWPAHPAEAVLGSDVFPGRD